MLSSARRSTRSSTPPGVRGSTAGSARRSRTCPPGCRSRALRSWPTISSRPPSRAGRTRRSRSRAGRATGPCRSSPTRRRHPSTTAPSRRWSSGGRAIRSNAARSCSPWERQSSRQVSSRRRGQTSGGPPTSRGGSGDRSRSPAPRWASGCLMAGARWPDPSTRGWWASWRKPAARSVSTTTCCARECRRASPSSCTSPASPSGRRPSPRRASRSRDVPETPPRSPTRSTPGSTSSGDRGRSSSGSRSPPRCCRPPGARMTAASSCGPTRGGSWSFSRAASAPRPTARCKPSRRSPRSCGSHSIAITPSCTGECRRSSTAASRTRSGSVSSSWRSANAPGARIRSSRSGRSGSSC